ncbi:MAG: hypothetical protein ACLPKI_26070 [Streptosporangiaceae bacterium]
MTGAVIADWLLGLLVILVVVGVPLWLTLRRKHTRPSYRDAQNHSRLRKRVAEDGPEAALRTPDYVPAERVNPLDGLTVPQDPGHGPAAGGQSGRPGRKPTPGDLGTTSGD